MSEPSGLILCIEIQQFHRNVIGLEPFRLNIFVRAVFSELRRRARTLLGLNRSQCGAVTFVQRFNPALGLNVHFHSHWMACIPPVRIQRLNFIHCRRRKMRKCSKR